MPRAALLLELRRLLESARTTEGLLRDTASMLVRTCGFTGARVLHWNAARSTFVARAGSSERSLEVDPFPITAEGEPCGAIVIAAVKEVAAEDRKLLEELGPQLGHSLRRLEQAAAGSLPLMDLAPLAIMHVDLETGFLVQFNERLSDMSGHARDELARLRYAELLADEGEDSSELIGYLREATLQVWDGETRFLRPDRSVVRRNVRASVLRDGGTRRHALLFVSEISRDNGVPEPGRHASAAVAPLGEEHTLLRQLVDHVPGMLAYWDATQRCRFANRAYESWFGVPCAALVGRSMQELLGPVYPLNLRYIEGALRGVPQTFERDIPLASGGPVRHSLAQYVPHVVEGAVRGFFVLVSDTSSLWEAEKRFRAVIEATPIPYSLNDEHSNVTYLNPEFVRVFGYTTEDIPTLAEWWPRAYPDETYREWVTQEWVARLATADRERAPFEPLEVRIQAKDGTAKTVLASATALGGSFGGSRLVVLYDVTEARRLEGERKHLESLLTHSQRLEGIGRLAGGIAHDFNNLLSVIVAYCELLASDLRDGDPRSADLGEIMNAAQRAAGLTRQLLTFSRREPQTVEHVDMSTLLTRTARMLERILGEDVRLEITGNDRPHVTLADAGQLEQIVMNLAVNARDAMPHGGHLSLSLNDFDLSGAEAAHHDLAPGPYVELSVKDSGTGMDSTTQDRLFEPFFTTKEVGKGTGLGLATVFGIVKQAGGAISVSSKPGQGTTFRVHLRRTDDVMLEAGAAPRGAANVPTPAGARTVVVVDDDAAVRKVLERVLMKAGYAVTSYASAPDALRHIERERANVQLLVTDILMPDMRGTELAREAKALSPSTKVLFMSGYADLKSNETLEHPLLRKPFHNADVLEQVAALLHP